MSYITETVIIDETFKDLMIERCYSLDQYVTVRNLGACYAKLHYGKYTYRNNEGEYTEEKKLIELKSIFKRLINKYLSFEHEGYRYYYDRGSWTKMKTSQ